ncbi:sugar phosphate isomerase/epimerase family protein [Alkalimonas amylolytica]|uniref:Sugar phosphate isomerase/epimerase n=1 Tax=Alkalimonas amylolytica TaxID=152573 RepID=A0A1H4B8B6_ALKAM|nr:sugar phosphate isomerase/epimerase family protein [Alkalimonas amylolytica]SEA44357.1 Sugar phosphate isomerase/epimerase [Alkalimonas amylolytica]
MDAAIYVSSSCVNYRSIAQSVQHLAERGYKAIELSGGTHYYPGFVDDLLRLKQQYHLQYRCHNYFPPPQQHFVLNLSASDDGIRDTAIAHVKQAIALSVQLEADRFAIHAGFRLQPAVEQLGQVIASQQLQPEQAALQRFAEAWAELQPIAAQAGVKLYVENNVLSAANLSAFGGENPFLATDRQSIEQLIAVTGAPLLLDVAHLKVSCQSLQLDFVSQLHKLMATTDYLHLSDNDGSADRNQGLLAGHNLLELLSQHDFSGKTITLEVYDGDVSLAQSMQAVNRLLELRHEH